MRLHFVTTCIRKGIGGGIRQLPPDSSGAMDILSELTDVINEAGGDVYDDYVATTEHPGNVLLAATLCISVVSIARMPLVVRLGRYLLATRLKTRDGKTDNKGGGGRLQSLQADDGPRDLRSLLDYLWTIVEFDDKTRRIIRLCVPMICSANVQHASELLMLALISYHLGMDAMLTYLMVYCILGITTSFLMGWVERIDSIVSMAYGAGNHELAGQYVQPLCLCYVFSVIPTLFFWEATLGRIMLLFGIDEAVTNMAQGFVKVHMAYDTATSARDVLEWQNWRGTRQCSSRWFWQFWSLLVSFA